MPRTSMDERKSSNTPLSGSLPPTTSLSNETNPPPNTTSTTSSHPNAHVILRVTHTPISTPTPSTPTTASQNIPTRQPPKPHRCDSPGCRKKYATASSLKKHQEEYHTPKHTCRNPKCTMMFPTPAYRNHHETVAHGSDIESNRATVSRINSGVRLEIESGPSNEMGPERELVCYNCDFTTPLVADFWRHLSSHMGDIHHGSVVLPEIKGFEVGVERKEELVCYVCGFLTIGKMDMEGHVYRFHRDLGMQTVLANTINASVSDRENDNNALLTCDRCGFSTVKKHVMSNHNVLVHKIVADKGVMEIRKVITRQLTISGRPLIRGILTCYLCGFRTVDKVHMGRHFSENHGDVGEDPEMVREIDESSRGAITSCGWITQ